MQTDQEVDAAAPKKKAAAKGPAAKTPQKQHRAAHHHQLQEALQARQALQQHRTQALRARAALQTQYSELPAPLPAPLIPVAASRPRVHSQSDPILNEGERGERQEAMARQEQQVTMEPVASLAQAAKLLVYIQAKKPRAKRSAAAQPKQGPRERHGLSPLPTRTWNDRLA